MIDPHEETRPAYLFHMDTITYSHRSSNGNKYETVIKCGASKVYFSLYLYLRSDMLLEFKDWIFKLRNSPAMHGLPYKACTVLRLDNAGEWELDHREWSAMAKELGIDMSYTSADRKEEAATAERACGIKEIKQNADLCKIILNRIGGKPKVMKQTGYSTDFLYDLSQSLCLWMAML